MNLQENSKHKIILALKLLSEINNNGYVFDSIDMKKGIVSFSNNEKEEKINIKNIMENISKEVVNTNVNLENKSTKTSNLEKYISETSDNQNGGYNGILKFSETSDNQNGGYNEILKYSETSEIQNGGYNGTLKFSETSEISEISNKILGGSKNMLGGSKNIFQKTKYSETSSVIFNERSDKYSDTSEIGQIGGNINEISDTLMDLSELKQKKNSKFANLDMGIFKKNQSGGSADTSVRRKMMEIGINSNSSTSSICE